VLLKGYGKHGKDRGRLSCRGVREMEGGKGARNDTDGTWLSVCRLTILQYSTLCTLACAMCHVMCHTGQHTNTQN